MAVAIFETQNGKELMEYLLRIQQKKFPSVAMVSAD
jgi:hypothetical protein